MEAVRKLKEYSPKTASFNWNSEAQKLLLHPVRNLSSSAGWSKYLDGLTAPSGIWVALGKEAFHVPEKFERVGSSLLAPREGMFIHIWDDSRAAVTFYQTWCRIWSVLFYSRIQGIAAPAGLTMQHQGSYITVLGIPPLFDYEPELFTLRQTGTSITTHMVNVFATALFLPESTTELRLHRGKDGRLYLMTLQGIFHHIPLGTAKPCARLELLENRWLEEKQSLSPEEYLRTHAIPAAIDDIAAQLNELEEKTAGTLIKEGILRATLRAHGVNIAFLYEVIASAQAANHEYAKVIADACVIEMIGRQMKIFVRVDFAKQSDTGKKSEDIRLDVVNRVARLTLGKDVTFWNEHLVPAIRKRYSVPDSFPIEPTGVSLLV